MSDKITLYGIPNCDTVKKARVWLDEQGIAYHFHDFKKVGLTAGQAQAWLKDVERDVLVNRKGTTWRALPDERKAAITDDAAAVALMVENPSVVKRPVLFDGKQYHVGFKADQYQHIFEK